MNKIAWAVIYAVIFLMSVETNAADISVSLDQDSDCSDLICDLQAALNLAGINNQDDNLYLESGTYNKNSSGGNFIYDPLESESFSLSLIGKGIDNTIIDGSNMSGGLGILDLINIRGNISIEGISFSNGKPSNLSGVNIEPFKVNIKIESSSFDTNAGGLIISNSSSTILVRNSRFIYNESDTNGGLNISNGTADSVVLENNLFSNNSLNVGTGGGANIEAEYVVVSGNIFERNSSGALTITDVTDTVDGADTILVNNTISNNFSLDEEGTWSGLLLRLRTDEAQAELYSNIIVNNLTPLGKAINDIHFDSGIDFNNDGKGGLIRLFNNNYGKLKASCFECSVQKEEFDSISADPLFVDAENGDFHLQASSPCINTGYDDAPQMLETDFDGDDRVIWDVPDMGADEYDGEIAEDISSGSSSSAGGCSLIK